MLDFFVYRHIRLDKNVPFYVGIGINNRRTVRVRYYERAYNKGGRSTWWHRVAANGYRVDILMDGLSKEDAILKEMEFISIYGRADLEMGTLVNMTDGGEGQFNPTESTRKKLSDRMKGNKNSAGVLYTEERRKKLSNSKKEYFKTHDTWCKGKKMPKSFGESISRTTTGRSLSETHRRKLINNTFVKSIICIETEIEYPSISECVRGMFGWNRAIKNSIIRTLKGNQSNYKGYTFKYA